MNLVFTICSINYLASAKTLAQSVRATNPNITFVYVIADKIDGRLPLNYFEQDEFIEVENLGIANLNELVETYNIIEFNTAIKPFAIKYLNEKYTATKIIYLDPDIIVFNSLSAVFEQLNKYDFIVTPHILQPIISIEFYAQQQSAINTGVFNLGFIGINYNQTTTPIIDWWATHMRNHGHCNTNIGEFYDQKIMNLLPIFSNNLLIEKNAGYNVAGWNIHERTITKQDNIFYVNNSPLIFYHYSGIINDTKRNLISSYNHLTTSYNTHITELLNKYIVGLQNNNHTELRNINCAYNLLPNIHKTTRFQMLVYKLKKHLLWSK